MATQPLTESEARALAERVLDLSQADEARVNLRSSRETNTRFANNQITTSGDVSDATLTVRSVFGRRTGTATTNRFDDASLRRAVETSERLARLSPEDPEYMGQLGPQTYPAAAEPWFESTATLSDEQRAAAARLITETARSRGLVATGFIPTRAASEAVATSAGLFAYTRRTSVALTTTVRTPDGRGSGWAGTNVFNWQDLDVRALAGRAADKAESSRGARPVEPGRWTVILEPTAVGSFVGFLMGALSARSADEGRSAFARPGGTRLGERLLDERVTIYSDPADPALSAEPFNSEGLPNRRMVWFERGALRSLQYDRYWAERQGVGPTGFADAYAMSGGAASVEEMIASTERGLLVTRFWYMRSVDQRSILYTGLTRDGTFLVERGRVVGPVQNLRWNESPLNVLANIEMLGVPQPVLRSEAGETGAAALMPALKVRGFRFTSVSDAV